MTTAIAYDFEAIRQGLRELGHEQMLRMQGLHVHSCDEVPSTSALPETASVWSTAPVLHPAPPTGFAEGWGESEEAHGPVDRVLAGIAIVGHTTPPNQGEWLYSLDSGYSWKEVPRDVRMEAALILSCDTLLQFGPIGGYNGVLPVLDTILLHNGSADAGEAETCRLLRSAQGPMTIADVDVRHYRGLRREVQSSSV